MKNEKSSILAKSIRKIISIIKTKNRLSTLFSISFRKFLKQDFMYSGRKQVETEPSCSHELVTFLKYHMPSRTLSPNFRRTRFNYNLFPTRFFPNRWRNRNWGVIFKTGGLPDWLDHTGYNWIVAAESREVWLGWVFNVVKRKDVNGTLFS